MKQVTPAEVNALHHAAGVFRDGAAKRQARMPSSADAMRKTAEQLESLRDKLIPELPPESQQAYR